MEAVRNLRGPETSRGPFSLPASGTGSGNLPKVPSERRKPAPWRHAALRDHATSSNPRFHYLRFCNPAFRTTPEPRDETDLSASIYLNLAIRARSNWRYQLAAVPGTGDPRCGRRSPLTIV